MDSSSVDYRAQIVSGKHRLLPYAIEFWIEHCSQYASKAGSLRMDQLFQQHLARMHDKHQQCLHALGRAMTQAQATDKTNTNVRLQLFSNMPICELMADVLSLRQLASQLDGENSSGRCRLTTPL
jgi:hypothetical protein